MNYRPKIRSRHPSHDVLRGKLPRFPFPCVIRLGSSTLTKNVFPNVNTRIIEINPVSAIEISASKLLMKQAFNKAEVKTAEWFKCATKDEAYDNIKKLGWKYPIIIKSIYGSRNRGNTFIQEPQRLEEWMAKNKDISHYIFEKFFVMGREYRLHITKNGCFYTCRKMLRRDAQEKWHRHDDNCVWIKEDNPLFDKPVNWDAIVSDCVKALTVIGADFLAFDVKVQTTKNKHGEVRPNPDFILIETASAPSFGDVTSQMYLEILPKLIQDKINI